MVSCGHKGMDMVDNNTQVDWDAQLVQNVDRKDPPEITPAARAPAAAWTPDASQDGSMPSCCFHQILNVAPVLKTPQTSQHSMSNLTSNVLLPNFGETVPIVPPLFVLSWQEWNLVLSSAAVAHHLLQGSTCAKFKVTWNSFSSSFPSKRMWNEYIHVIYLFW